jgi:hypothetical protein
LEEDEVHRGLECQKKKRKEIFLGKPEGEADPDIFSTLLTETQNRLLKRSNKTETRPVKNNRSREKIN